MSYLIQNFYTVNQSLILNQKLYLMWVLRNMSIILTLIIKSLTLFLNVSVLSNPSSLVYTFTHLFFGSSFFIILKTVVSKWKPFLGSNLTRSMQYWIFKTGIHYVDDKQLVVVVKSPSLSKNLIENQYVLNQTISNISLHSKYYRTVMLKFLIILLTNWQLWNKHHSITFKFLLINKNFNLIRYYNFYFFKIYNF